MKKPDQQDEIKEAILSHYQQLATEEIKPLEPARTITESLGYKPEDLNALPPDADLGLGCGNPHERARPQKGEQVLDLGSGRGLDCFLAARAVGETGRVVGVDALESMVEKARSIARKHGFDHCHFIQGEVEAIPCESDTFDLVMSNCVINLSSQKATVYKEIFRVLKAGGRVAISDITTKKPLPGDWVADPHMAKT